MLSNRTQTVTEALLFDVFIDKFCSQKESQESNWNSRSQCFSTTFSFKSNRLSCLVVIKGDPTGLVRMSWPLIHHQAPWTLLNSEKINLSLNISEKKIYNNLTNWFYQHLQVTYISFNPVSNRNFYEPPCVCCYRFSDWLWTKWSSKNKWDWRVPVITLKEPLMISFKFIVFH